ncbi:MAG: STAS domain-containing protein [Planctomycetes bacterium]|nr:STAS domain-containing protein [Planctomycetota bacterium]
MNIASEQHVAAMVIQINGEMTADECDNFKRKMLEATNNFASDIIVDCTSLSLIDSVGLESLLWLSDEARRNKSRMRLACVPKTVSNILRLTRLDGAFSTHSNVEAAARSLH